MKKKFLNTSIKIIKDNNPKIDEVKIEEIAYGLEGIYLTITKLVIIFLLAFLLGIVKEVLLLLITYNIIRTNAFGIHATKSIYCLICSIIFFVGGVYICNYLYLPLWLKIVLSVICIICLFKYAPADTEKRPIINKKKRIRHKVISTCSGIIYLIFIIIFNKNMISNYLLIGMIESVIMIHPFIYKIFKLSYDNYKNYNYGV
jgi:accessory gene regulator B